MRKTVVFMLIFTLFANVLPLFAAEKSIFQCMHDTLKRAGKKEARPAVKKPKTAVAFQRAADYIKKSRPKVKPLSLRGGGKEVEVAK